MRAQGKYLGVLFAAALGCTVLSCRDGVAPYDPPAREAQQEGTVRLTWGIGDDRDPQWSPDGKSLYYHTTHSHELGGSSLGLLMRLDLESGLAVPLAPDAQAGGAVPLLDPVPSADGARLAYVQLYRMNSPAQCAASFVEGPTVWQCDAVEPRLDTAFIRVRNSNATGSAGEDAGVRVGYEGPDPRRTRTEWPGPYYQRTYPFQERWVTSDDAASLRPAFSRNAQQVVFSDGLRLLLWNVGAPSAAPIPNTADGVAPAWSPDGQWIAFTVFQRTDSLQVQCACMEGSQGARHWRWLYFFRERLAVVRPDGTGMRVLTDGHQAAWSPASDRIYFVHQRQIHSIPLNGGAPAAIAGTEDGYMPAVSPDGKSLAFARQKNVADGDYDLYVTRLQP